MTKLPLVTVRPFEFGEVVLSEHDELQGDNPEGVDRFLRNHINQMIESASRKHKELQQICGVELDDMKPLIRLKVDYSDGFHMLNAKRFGQAFVDRVANPNDILQFHKRKLVTAPKEKDHGGCVHDEPNPEPTTVKLENILQDVIEHERLEFNILSEADLTEAVRLFVDKDEKDIFKQCFMKRMEGIQNYLTRKSGLESYSVDAIAEEVRNTAKILEQTSISYAPAPRSTGAVVPTAIAAPKQVRAKAAPTKRGKKNGSDSESNEEEDDDADFADSPAPTPQKSAPKRAALTSSSTTTSATSATTTSTARGRWRGRGRGSAAVQSSNKASLELTAGLKPGTKAAKSVPIIVPDSPELDSAGEDDEPTVIPSTHPSAVSAQRRPPPEDEGSDGDGFDPRPKRPKKK